MKSQVGGDERLTLRHLRTANAIYCDVIFLQAPPISHLVALRNPLISNTIHLLIKVKLLSVTKFYIHAKTIYRTTRYYQR
jgi:hypothetical protein